MRLISYNCMVVLPMVRAVFLGLWVSKAFGLGVGMYVVGLVRDGDGEEFTESW